MQFHEPLFDVQCETMRGLSPETYQAFNDSRQKKILVKVKTPKETTQKGKNSNTKYLKM